MQQILPRYCLSDALVLMMMNLYSDLVVELKGCGKNVRIPPNFGVKKFNNLALIFFLIRQRCGRVYITRVETGRN